MKIRNGFVTNSSSSSFIFKDSELKKDGVYELTTETLFKWLKEKAEECTLECEQFIEIIQRYGLVYDADTETITNSITHSEIRGCMNIWNEIECEKELLEKYELDLSDAIWAIERFIGSRETLGWTEYNTYKEFQESYETGRFTICKYSEYMEPDYDCLSDISWFKYENKELSKRLDEATSTKEALAILGDIAIHSENGNLPELLVDKLCYRASYACKHMG